MSTIKVSASIDRQIWDEAAAVLRDVGLTPSEAFRVMLMQIAAEKALPFACLIPNEETVAALEAVERGEVITVGSVADLMDYLHNDDEDS